MEFALNQSLHAHCRTTLKQRLGRRAKELNLGHCTAATAVVTDGLDRFGVELIHPVTGQRYRLAVNHTDHTDAGRTAHAPSADRTNAGDVLFFGDVSTGHREISDRRR